MARSEDTFRPPRFHRNYMSEYMLLYAYDAKEEGLSRRGGSLHKSDERVMTGMPKRLKKASNADLKPQKRKIRWFLCLSRAILSGPTRSCDGNRRIAARVFCSGRNSQNFKAIRLSFVLIKCRTYGLSKRGRAENIWPSGFSIKCQKGFRSKSIIWRQAHHRHGRFTKSRQHFNWAIMNLASLFDERDGAFQIGGSLSTPGAFVSPR